MPGASYAGAGHSLGVGAGVRRWTAEEDPAAFVHYGRVIARKAPTTDAIRSPSSRKSPPLGPSEAENYEFSSPENAAQIPTVTTCIWCAITSTGNLKSERIHSFAIW